MKKQADKHRSERVFKVGDQVFLKLQSYVQSSLLPRSNQKLSFKFFGPFTITTRVGEVAYRLALPDATSIHPVFHVSQLKQAWGTGCSALPVLPEALESWQVPEKILQRRMVSQGAQVLVKWSSLPTELATWENLGSLHQRFPAAPAWGHAGSQGERGVSTMGNR